MAFFGNLALLLVLVVQLAMLAVVYKLFTLVKHAPDENTLAIQ